MECHSASNAPLRVRACPSVGGPSPALQEYFRRWPSFWTVQVTSLRSTLTPFGSRAQPVWWVPPEQLSGSRSAPRPGRSLAIRSDTVSEAGPRGLGPPPALFLELLLDRELGGGIGFQTLV